MSDRKVLVLGPSLAAEVMNLIGDGFKRPGVKFVIYSINGRAFTSDQLMSSQDGQMTFLPVKLGDDELRWMSNNKGQLQVDLAEYRAVLHLDPLFMLGGAQRWQLWHGGCGVCYEFLPAELRQRTELLPRNARPISAAEWLAIYLDARKGTIKTLEVIRELQPEIPILLIPPANPPQRMDTGVYPQYNMREQRYLAAHLQSRFGTSFALQPRSTLDAEFRTLDQFHQPAPDMHHPRHTYYRAVLESIDFEAMQFSGEMRDIWLAP